MPASISVCVPAYNAVRTLDATMRSILDQDMDFDVLVLDNATEDGTADVAHSFEDPRIRVVRNPEVLPIGANWNKAVELSTGDLVKIVCADDLLWPGSLAAQSAVMEESRIALTSARFDVIGEDGQIRERNLGIPGLVGVHSPRALVRTIVRRGPADFGPTAASMFRRSHFEQVGGFKGDLVFPMDVDLFARVCTFGMFSGTTRSLAAWRDSTFNLCSRTSSFSKLTDMLLFHHRIASDYPDLVTVGDVIVGDIRLVRAGVERLAVRSRGLVARPRR